MALQLYSKPALLYQQQIQQLKDRGLLFSDERKALHILKNISYYRLSGYWYPLLEDKALHTFKTGSTFDNAFRLYCFDRELRKIIGAEVEKLEIAIRSILIYEFSHVHGPFWFSDSSLFRNQFDFQKTMENMERETARSDEEFIIAFQGK